MEKKDLENFIEEVVKTVKDGLNKLAEKTDQLTTLGRIKLDIISLKRDIEKHFSELGGRVYHLAVEESNEKVLADEEVQNSLEKIKILEERLSAKKEELEQVAKAEKSKNGSDTESGDATEQTATASAAGANSQSEAVDEQAN